MRFTMAAALLFAFGAGAQMTSDVCLGCHEDATPPANAIHRDLACTDCHGEIADYPHDPKPVAVDCAGCHSDAAEKWTRSRHAKARKAGNRHAAGCVSCHGHAHKIVPRTDPTSSVAHANVPKTCAACHAQKLVMEQSHLKTQAVFSYQESVHGKAVAGGSAKAAVCTDCHDSHEVLGADSATSPIFKFNIPKTCGKCHGNITTVYAGSVHGQAAARGSSQAPVCTDCHGIHNIKSHIDPASSVASQNIARTTCGQCHGNVRMTREFGLSSSRVKSYEASYHGMAKRLGSDEAANCASCHGVHDIRSAGDPLSLVNKKNLPETCGRCHPGAGEHFVEGRIHLEELPLEQEGMGDKVLRWVSWIYVPLILVTLGAMALHNIVIWVWKARKARKDRARTVLRMNRAQRAQHFVLVTSFFALVISGFALAWPDSIFATITFGEDVRRLIHRIAAVVMLGLGLVHVAYMTSTKEGRQGLKDFWFGFKDVRDAIAVMKLHLGLTTERPKMGRFTYAEKAEYWALIWGTIVMGVTGLMLWFEVQVSAWLGLPRWWVDVATLIHYYEAILATLAILIWHLYAVIFDPDIYPMNWAWYDGKAKPEEQEES